MTNLTADVAIGKPQQFLARPGADFLWAASTTNGVVRQSGLGTTDPNALVSLPGIQVPRDPERLVLAVSLPPALTAV